MFRRRIDNRLSPGVTNKEWEFLVKRGIVDDWAADRSAAVVAMAVEMLQDVRESQQASGAPRPRRTSDRPLLASDHTAPSTPLAALNEHALSELVAVIAADDGQLEAFRVDVLAGVLLRPSQVKTWIADRYREQGGDGGNYAIVSGTTDDDLEVTDTPRLNRLLEVTGRVLEYVVPGEQRSRIVGVRPRGVLDRLRLLSEGLARAHGWQPAQATTFVLTGMTPWIGLIRVTEGGTTIHNGMWCAWRDRITLEVHPNATPEQVVDAYRAARSRLDQDRNGESAPQPRALSAKHLKLAAFVADLDEPWPQIMRAWNAQCEQNERYSHVSNFRRDAARARYHVLYRRPTEPRRA